MRIATNWHFLRHRSESFTPHAIRYPTSSRQFAVETSNALIVERCGSLRYAYLRLTALRERL